MSSKYLLKVNRLWGPNGSLPVCLLGFRCYVRLTFCVRCIHFKICPVLWKTDPFFFFLIPFGISMPHLKQDFRNGKNLDHSDAFWSLFSVTLRLEKKRWLSSPRSLSSRCSQSQGFRMLSEARIILAVVSGTYILRTLDFHESLCGISSPLHIPSLLFPFLFHNSIALLSFETRHCLELISTIWRSMRERKLENSD